MQWEIVILIIFFVIILPFSLNITFEVNVLRNKGKIIILLFGFLPLYIQYIEFDRGFIKLIKNPQKIKKIKINFDKENIKKFNQSIRAVLNSQLIKDINIQTKFGIKDAPFVVALASGIYNSIISAFLSINCAKRNIINSHTKLKTYFKYNYLKVSIQSKIQLSIYDVIKLFIQIKWGANVQ